MNDRRFALLGAAALAAVSFSVPAYAENGWTREPLLSVNTGVYVADDGMVMDIFAEDSEMALADTRYTYNGEWNEVQGELLTYTGTGKKRARSDSEEFYNTPYTFGTDSRGKYLEVGEPPYKSDAKRAGRYYLQEGLHTWQKLDDGRDVWITELDELKQGLNVTDDGWYVDGDGIFLPEMGMAAIKPGAYRTYYDPAKAIPEATWSISVYTNLDLSDWKLKDSSDKREVGRADYYAAGNDGSLLYEKRDMPIFNTMAGYVVEDVSGQEVAWLQPVGDHDYLMVQMYGNPNWQIHYLAYGFDEGGGYSDEGAGSGSAASVKPAETQGGAGGWRYEDGSWKYAGADGQDYRDRWLQDDDGKWYHFDEFGRMETSTYTSDGFYVGADGSWQETAEPSGRTGGAYDRVLSSPKTGRTGTGYGTLLQDTGDYLRMKMTFEVGEPAEPDESYEKTVLVDRDAVITYTYTVWYSDTDWGIETKKIPVREFLKEHSMLRMLYFTQNADGAVIAITDSDAG